MKKLFILLAVTVLFSYVSNAQTKEEVKKEEKQIAKHEKLIKQEKKEDKKELRILEGHEVSFQARKVFITDFNNIPVSKWERVGNFDEATFVKDGNVTKAYYDIGGKLVGTTTIRSFASLPANAQSTINAEYKGYTNAGVIFFDDNEFNEMDMVLFGNRFNDADNYFVQLNKGNEKIILQVTINGDVDFFTKLK